MQSVSDTVAVRKEKRFAKTLRLSSDQLVSLNDMGSPQLSFQLTEIVEPETWR